ncbi:MAG: nitroreductase family protein, partial [Candidatus Zixiibacteriota bacterium]
EYPVEEMQRRAREFYENLSRRRTVRQFSSRPVPRDIIENCLRAAGTAPSGANMQPWRFVVVSNPEIKKKIRAAAEEVESDFYHRRAPKYWLEALAPLGTDENKPYLEDAPYLIVVFTVRHTRRDDGELIHHYYLPESVGIATGMLITALHHAGLVCLTPPPSPMGFLRDILGRPKSENPFLVVVTGYPAEDARVPVITKKPLDEIAVFIE